MPSSLSRRRVTKIRGATCGRPKVKTSCARSTPPDRRSPPSSPTVTLFQRRNTSAPEMASRCYPARYAQGGGSPQCAATEEPYLRHTSLDRNRCWRHTRQWHLVMPSLPEMRVERDWRSSAARPSASGRSRGSDADRQGYGQARQDGGPDITCERLKHVGSDVLSLGNFIL